MDCKTYRSCSCLRMLAAAWGLRPGTCRSERKSTTCGFASSSKASRASSTLSEVSTHNLGPLCRSLTTSVSTQKILKGFKNFKGFLTISPCSLTQHTKKTNKLIVDPRKQHTPCHKTCHGVPAGLNHWLNTSKAERLKSLAASSCRHWTSPAKRNTCKRNSKCECYMYVVLL